MTLPHMTCPTCKRVHVLKKGEVWKGTCPFCIHGIKFNGQSKLVPAGK